MATHDYVIANQSASNARIDINNALSAIVSNNSGASAPSVTYANMFWYDTTNNLLKMRNEADTNWIDLFYLDQSGNDAEVRATTIQQPNASSNVAVKDSTGTEVLTLSPPSQAQAEAGTDNLLAMTALRTRQAIITGSNVAEDGYANFSFGMQMRWGTDTSTADASESFTFDSAFSTNCFCVILTAVAVGNASPLNIATKSTTGFTVNRDDSLDGSIDFNYIAIGN